MSKEFVAGVSFSDDTAQTAVFEVREDNVELQYLSEHTKKDGGELWFFDALFGLKGRKVRKISRVSVAIDNSLALTHTFPLDCTLTQTEQNEHVQWETSNFLPDYRPQDFINDLHTLQTDIREGVSEVSVVTVRRSMIHNIQRSLTEHGLEIHILDTNHFGAEYALLRGYPENKTKTIALVCISRNRMDVGILEQGQLKSYRFAMVSSVEEGREFIGGLKLDTTFRDVFLYGTSVSSGFLAAIRSMSGVKVTLLNPFRRINVASSCREFDQFIGKEYRFSACTGIALRKE